MRPWVTKTLTETLAKTNITLNNIIFKLKSVIALRKTFHTFKILCSYQR